MAITKWMLDLMADTEALQGMMAPGAGLRGVTLFRSKTRRRPKKKGFRSKITGFLVQMRLETK